MLAGDVAGPLDGDAEALHGCGRPASVVALLVRVRRAVLVPAVARAPSACRRRCSDSRASSKTCRLRAWRSASAGTERVSSQVRPPFQQGQHVGRVRRAEQLAVAGHDVDRRGVGRHRPGRADPARQLPRAARGDPGAARHAQGQAEARPVGAVLRARCAATTCPFMTISRRWKGTTDSACAATCSVPPLGRQLDLVSRGAPLHAAGRSAGPVVVKVRPARTAAAQASNVNGAPAGLAQPGVGADGPHRHPRAHLVRARRRRRRGSRS